MWFTVHVRLGFVSSSLGKTASNWAKWFLDVSCCCTVKWFSAWPTWKWARNEKGLGAWILRCRVEFHFFNWVALQNPESSCVYRSWFNSAYKLWGVSDMMLSIWFPLRTQRLTGWGMEELPSQWRLTLFFLLLEGVCLGMQLAVVEFSRNVLGWQGKCLI